MSPISFKYPVTSTQDRLKETLTKLLEEGIVKVLRQSKTLGNNKPTVSMHSIYKLETYCLQTTSQIKSEV